MEPVTISLPKVFLSELMEGSLNKSNGHGCEECALLLAVFLGHHEEGHDAKNIDASAEILHVHRTGELCHERPI